MADDLDDRSVWARPVFLVSAVLVVAVVVLGVWLAVANERRDDGAPPAATAPATAGPDGAAATGEPTGEPGDDPTTDGSDDLTADADGGTDGPADDGEPGDEPGDGATGAAPPAGTDGTADPAAAGEPSVCGMGPAQTDGTVTRAPEGVAWELVGTVAAPALPGTGPGVKEPDGFRSCYAQSPTGALLAAANIVAMGSVDALLPRTTAELTATGPGRDAAVARLDAEAADAAAADSAAVTATPTTDPTAATTAPPAPAPVPLPATVARYQIRGFHVIAYDGASASVDIALGLDNGALGSFVVDLLWQGGDWKVRLTDIGTLPTPPAQIPNLAGYTVWSGA